MSQTDFTKFLWKSHNLVYLRPANANDFQLLDVLVKVDWKWAFPCDRRPVLRRIGSLFSPVVGGITDVQAEVEVTWQALEEELEELNSSAGRDFGGKYLHTVSHGSWKFQKDSSASAGVSAGPSVAVETRARAGYGYECVINDVKSKSVDITSLTKCFSSETNPWTPNVDYIRMWHAPRNERELELWVITKLFYHNGIHFEKSRGVGVGVTIPFGVGSQIAVEDGVVVEMDASSAFAYQAIRLRYNLQEHVKLTQRRLNMGRAMPEFIHNSALPTAPEFTRPTNQDTEAEANKPIPNPKQTEFNIATDTNQDSLRIRNGCWCNIIDPNHDPDFNMADLLDMEAWESLLIK